jgi:DNA-binding NtrC family response regulator
MTARILVADDEPNLRKVLEGLLRQDGHETIAAANGAEALEVLRRGEVDLLISDLRMPELDGLALLERVRAQADGPPVIIITAHGSVDTAVAALRAGASDYITKPFDKDELRLAVRKGLAQAEHRKIRSPGVRRLVGESASITRVKHVIERVAATPSTVLITGESGTGKELVAAALHQGSDRARALLVRVNCAAIPKDLIESEFFGHERGAFTGAVNAKPGRFELADGGTLFLDEIAEIPVETQVKLLRALQEGEFERVGGVRTLRVDVRLIAATNRDLAQLIAAGRFREDLYYRLNVIPIHVAPLRERGEDIPLLVDAFLAKNSARLGRKGTAVAADAMAALQRYPWPGNVRELENVIERTLLFCDDNRIEAANLPTEILDRARANSPAPRSTETTGTLKEIVREATARLERDLIERALAQTEGNVTHAASLLGLSRKGLQLKMKELGVLR